MAREGSFKNVHIVRCIYFKCLAVATLLCGDCAIGLAAAMARLYKRVRHQRAVVQKDDVSVVHCYVFFAFGGLIVA